MISVLVADDQALVRRGMRLILEDQPDIRVVAEAADGVAAVELARRHRPDVCLVDVRMPRLDGVGVTRALAGVGAASAPRVVVVTTFDTDEYVYGALRCGATGFLLKDAGPALLVEAVRAAAAGESLVSPSVAVRLLKHITGGAPGARGEPPRRALSARESEVARAVARGRTNREIAAELFVSLSTVKTHVAGISAKLGARNRVEIAAWAWDNGLMQS